MKNIARQRVATFAKMELRERAAPASLIVDEVQRVDGFVNASDLGDGLRQRCRGAHKIRKTLCVNPFSSYNFVLLTSGGMKNAASSDFMVEPRTLYPSAVPV